MKVARSARKHGVTDEDISHAWTHAMRYIVHDHGGETRLLVIGPDHHGNLLELVAVPSSEPDRVIHADRLRPKFYDFLKG